MIDISELMFDPDFVQAVTLKTVTFDTVDFQPVAPAVTAIEILASVQPADKRKLNPDTIDWSLDYKMIHSATPLDLGKFIEYGGRDYKIIQLNNYGDNGYYEVVGEETKQPLLVPPPPPEPDEEP